MKENKNYCTPIVEVLNARVEKGFQVTGGQEQDQEGFTVDGADWGNGNTDNWTWS